MYGGVNQAEKEAAEKELKAAEKEAAEKEAAKKAEFDQELVAAVKAGDAAEVMRLGQEGASPDAKDQDSTPALVAAAAKGH
eukprot:COSAG04_NODE_12055_length_673_cov_1.017422_1_plen_80_part_10